MALVLELCERRESDGQGQSAFRLGSGGDGGVVGRGHGTNDGQSEAVAALVVGATRVYALDGRKRRSISLVGMTGPVLITVRTA